MKEIVTWLMHSSVRKRAMSWSSNIPAMVTWSAMATTPLLRAPHFAAAATVL